MANYYYAIQAMESPLFFFYLPKIHSYTSTLMGCINHYGMVPSLWCIKKLQQHFYAIIISEIMVRFDSHTPSSGDESNNPCRRIISSPLELNHF